MTEIKKPSHGGSRKRRMNRRKSSCWMGGNADIKTGMKGGNNGGASGFASELYGAAHQQGAGVVPGLPGSAPQAGGMGLTEIAVPAVLVAANQFNNRRRSGRGRRTNRRRRSSRRV